MKIQQSPAHSNQQVIDKTKQEKANKPEQSNEVSGRDKLKDFMSAADQRLFIGAKSLMASLNKELKLDGSFSFSNSSSQQLDIKSGQSSLLDKIDVEPITFDFEAVAKNVMEFVSGVIKGAQAGGASDDKLKEMLEQAREGVDMGFEMARAELGDMDMLNDDVEQGMDKSYDLIQQGLTNLNDELFKPPQTESAGLAAQGLAMSEREQGSISVTTRDGDTVNISFANEMSMQLDKSIDQGRISSQFSLSNNQSFSFEVQGSLDKDELKAVSQLVQEIGKLADEFFNGDVEKAWQQANELDFDQQQIAQYALDFQEVKQVAVKQSYIGDSAPSSIATLSPYIKELNDVLDDGQALFSGNNLKQMMNDIAQQQIDLTDSLVSKSAENFVNFNQLLEDVQNS